MLETLCVLSSLPFGLTVYNLLTWKRPVPSAREQARVSLLIPARNEAERIGPGLRAALASSSPSGVPLVRELLVYDDDSSDETTAIVEGISSTDPRVRLIRGGPLKAGWIGKPHACHQLFEHASSEVLVFMDADVRLEVLGLARLLEALESGADVVSAVPRQVTLTLAEQAVVSLMLVTYLSWLPLNMVERHRDPRFIAANGQLLALRRDTAQKLRGFSAVRQALVDDVAFTRNAKRRGFRVRFADGTQMAHCRMYRSAREVWLGFSKNIAAGLGGGFMSVLLVTALYALCFVWPYFVLLDGMLNRDATNFSFGLGGVALNLALRALVAIRFRQSWASVFLHPIGTLLLILIAWNSFRWMRQGKVAWAGRTYGEVAP